MFYKDYPYHEFKFSVDKSVRKCPLTKCKFYKESEVKIRLFTKQNFKSTKIQPGIS